MPRFSWASLGLATTVLSVLLAPIAVHAEPDPTSVHVVQSGETLLQIALDAGTDSDALASLNDLGDANLLTVGQSLKLPAKGAASGGAITGGSSAPVATATSSSSSSPAPAPAKSPAAANGYTLVSGDNLWDVAQRYGTTTDAIVQLNHLDDSEHVIVGTMLSMPAGSQPRATPSTPSASSATGTPTPSSSSSSSSATTSTPRRGLTVSYTVQPGETLTQIARRFDVRPDTIVQASGLSDANKLPVGTVLKVPAAGKEHVVTDGETLRDIASSEKVDLGSLIDFNQIDDPALIRVGQVVLLPVAAAQPASGAVAPAPTSAPAANAAPSPSTATLAPAAPAGPPAPTPAGVVEAVGPDTQTAAGAPPQPRASASATPTPTTSPTPQPQASGATAPTPKPTLAAKPSPKPVMPIAVVAPPPGAPTDGLAGLGLKFLGTPYVWGGASPGGFDCSGFVWYVAHQLNKQVSRGMFGQYNSGSHPSRDELRPGDLVFFQNTWTPGLSHNGIFIGNNLFVNAADETSGVTISSLNTAYWSTHWFGATRLP